MSNLSVIFVKNVGAFDPNRTGILRVEILDVTITPQTQIERMEDHDTSSLNRQSRIIPLYHIRTLRLDGFEPSKKPIFSRIIKLLVRNI